ncbi:MAG: hypothetical protein AB1502_04790 [Thermodesulfobacteriota bacterium]
MPELNLKTDERFRATASAGIVYGIKSININFPKEEAYSVAWSRENIMFQEYLFSISGKVHYFLTPFVNQESYVASEASGFQKETDPFTQANLLDYEENQIQELIFRIRTSPSISCKEIANRLLLLLNDAKEEELSIAIDSFRNFYNFFQLNTNMKCPTISLTPENNIYASWKGEQNRLFSVHFLPSGSVRFVIFKPNDRHPEQQIRLSGIATSDILKETVSAYGVWDWISE